MPLNGMTLLQSGTISATGGTSKTFTADGQLAPGGVHLIDASVTDYRTRPSITTKYKPPTLDKSGAYSKAKHSMTGVRPFISADGMTHFNLVRTEIEIHPETPETERVILRAQGAQHFSDADTDNFWVAGSAA